MTILTPDQSRQARETPLFVPELVYFEPAALDYPKGRQILEWVKQRDLPYKTTSSHNRITGLPGETELEQYKIAKRTLVVGIRKTLKFDTSKPSAEYALPLSTGCMGHCHYCYLQTTLGAKPYIRVYVNTEDILLAAKGIYRRTRAGDHPLRGGMHIRSCRAGASDRLACRRHRLYGGRAAGQTSLRHQVPPRRAVAEPPS